MDDPRELINDWIDDLAAEYGPDGLPTPERYEAAIRLIEEAQALLVPRTRLTLVT